MNQTVMIITQEHKNHPRLNISLWSLWSFCCSSFTRDFFFESFQHPIPVYGFSSLL